MAKVKNPAKKVLTFSSPEEVEEKERVVLFTWDDTEFTVPHADDISPMLVIEIFEAADQNPFAGTAELLRELLGEDQYEDFKALPLKRDQFELIMGALMEHATGASKLEPKSEEGKK